ncbi:Uncharacterised protein [uncultured archaeon]|nr:Uncharacterised protein [uncultured archaeon]
MNITAAGSISQYFGVAKVSISNSNGFASPGLSSSMGISSSLTSSSSCVNCTRPSELFASADSNSANLWVGTQPSIIKAFWLVAKRRGASAFWVSSERYSSAAIMNSEYSFLILSSSVRMESSFSSRAYTSLLISSSRTWGFPVRSGTFSSTYECSSCKSFCTCSSKTFGIKRANIFLFSYSPVNIS